MEAIDCCEALNIYETCEDMMAYNLLVSNR